MHSREQYLACHFFVNFPPHCKQFILPLSSTDDWNRAAGRPRRIPGCIHAVPASLWPRCGMWRISFAVPHTRTGPDLHCAVSHGQQPLPLLRSRVFRTSRTAGALRVAALLPSSIALCDTRDACSFPSISVVSVVVLDCLVDVPMHCGNTMYYFWAYCKYKV